jgi:hypothetical protein
LILWTASKVIKLKKVGQFKLMNQEHKLLLEAYYGQDMLVIIVLIQIFSEEFTWEMEFKFTIQLSYYDNLIRKKNIIT